MSDPVSICVEEHDDPAEWLVPDRSLTQSAETIQLVLDAERRQVSVRTQSHDATGTPAEVWHNRVYWLKMASDVDATRLAGWLSERQGVLRRICDGHSVEWDGSNMRGRLTEDAQAALDELQSDLGGVPDGRAAVPTKEMAIWQADRWLEGMRLDTAAEYDLSPAVTAERLKEVATALHSEARGSGVKLVGLPETLREIAEEDHLSREKTT